MAGKTTKSIFLDTNAIIAWVGNEHNSGVTAISGILGAIGKRELSAAVSQLTRLEILECKHSATMMTAWRRFQARPNVEVLAVTKKVINVAYEIRNYYQALREADPACKKPPTQPDCLLIATAIVAGVDHFVSYDGGRREPKHLSPRELNGRIANQWMLSVIPPEALDLQAFAV